jgi:hypothetical protein
LADADAYPRPDRRQLGQVAVGAEGEVFAAQVQAQRLDGADADGLGLVADQRQGLGDRSSQTISF